ncbi:TPA: hypothetical protein ACORDH_002879 [Bacillus cereus]
MDRLKEFNERLLWGENKGYTSVIAEGEGIAFFVKENNLIVGDVVKNSLGHDFKVVKILSKSRVIAEEI